MKLTTAFALSGIIAILSGCSSMKTTSERMSDYDFSTIQSYSWLDAPEEILNEEDTYVSEYLMMEIDKTLAGRDWKRVSTNEVADIQVTYYVKLAEHKEYTAPADSGETRVTGGFTYNRDSGSWNPSDQNPDLNVYTIETGTLMLHIRDAKTGDLVWTGTLKTRVDRSTPIPKQIKVFTKIANKIEAQIPTGAK